MENQAWMDLWFLGTLGLSISTKALHCLYQWSVAKHKMKNFCKAQRSRERYAVKRKGNWHWGGRIFRYRGQGIRQTTRWSAPGQSPAGRRAGGAPGMKGAALRKAPAHRSHCDDLTKGIYVAFKYISKGVVNNRKRGDFTFTCSIAEAGSQIAKYCVETLKGYEKVGEWVGKNG